MTNLVTLTGHSLQILDETQTRVFSIFGYLVKCLINKNCPNSRTSNCIDMKLGPATKLDKGYKTTSKKVDNDPVSTNYDIFVIFPVYGYVGAIQKPDFGLMIYNSYI